VNPKADNERRRTAAGDGGKRGLGLEVGELGKEGGRN
jgi:hypothetical protein